MTLTVSPDGLTEVYKSFVPTWEQDENDHWNAQFYIRAFQHAAETVAIGVRGDNPGAAVAPCRHLRYVRDLRGGDPMRVLSGRLADPVGPYDVVHVMRHGVTDDLCAIAFDTAGCDLSALPGHVLAGRDTLGPRTVAVGPHDAADTTAWLRDGRALVSHLSIARPAEFDHRGALLAHAVHARITQAAPHVWVHLNAPWDQFFAAGLGRVLVEVKVTRQGTCAPGDALRMVSWFEQMAAKAFVVRHQLEHMTSGEPVASVTTVSLVFDIRARKAVPVPPMLVEAFARTYGA